MKRAAFTAIETVLTPSRGSTSIRLPDVNSAADVTVTPIAGNTLAA